MKVVIDIPKNVIEDAKSSPNYYLIYYFVKIWKAIANSTPYEEKPQGKRAEGALLIIDRLYIEGHISNTEQGILRRAVLLPEKGGAE